jgi:hypothetical protein
MKTKITKDNVFASYPWAIRIDGYLCGRAKTKDAAEKFADTFK